MQDPNEDTQWNDVLRQKGIIPPKQDVEITEDKLAEMVENAIEEKSKGRDMGEMDLDELNELEDDIDEESERIFEEYRRQRMAEMQAESRKTQFGSVLEITKADYVDQVNKAGEGVWVVLHVYNERIPLCKVLNQHLGLLARKFTKTKFVKSVSDLCIPNYPDKNLPTIFIYFEGDMKKQFIGPMHFGGMNLKIEELEWMLKETGAVASTMEKNPRRQIDDVMDSAIRQSNVNNTESDDDNDW